MTTDIRSPAATENRLDPLLDERISAYVRLAREPGGEQRMLPGETREDAIARLMHHYGWDEDAAGLTLAVADGWSDVVPIDDDGAPLPYFRIRDLPEPAKPAAPGD